MYLANLSICGWGIVVHADKYDWMVLLWAFTWKLFGIFFLMHLQRSRHWRYWATHSIWHVLGTVATFVVLYARPDLAWREQEDVSHGVIESLSEDLGNAFAKR